MNGTIFFRLCASVWLLAVCAYAQVSAFPRRSYFRQTFARPVTKVELRAPARLRDFEVNGKLELSLRSYLELVMANNTDISIQRLTVDVAQNAITRAFAPFDPVATAAFTNRRSKTPANDVLAGASTLVQLQQPASFGYSQILPNGTSYDIGFFGQKVSTNSGFQSFNPALTANLAMSFAQPLLRNRGTYVNRLPIMQARSRLRRTEYSFRDILLRLISDAENVYWDLVLARESLRVQESALQLNGEALKRAQRELELGAMSPLDIYQPQQVYATSEIAVSQARYLLRQREDALRRQIGADLDPQVRNLPIDLTETVAPPADEATVDAETAVERALANRPDLKAAVQELDVDDLGIRLAKNNLLPDVSLIGGYTSQGRGGVYYPRSGILGDPSVPEVVTPVPGGFGDALSQLFGFGYPVYSFGLQIRLPIKNRAASADLADALVAKKRDTLQVRTVEQAVRLDVLNSVNQLESAKASVKLAATALNFAQKYLDAEQKKYELGTSQIYFVLQAQQSLVNARSDVVQNAVAYRRALTDLLRRTGELLDERGIQIQ
jgi:outer membrane protein TolC